MKKIKITAKQLQKVLHKMACKLVEAETKEANSPAVFYSETYSVPNNPSLFNSEEIYPTSGLAFCLFEWYRFEVQWRANQTATEPLGRISCSIYGKGQDGSHHTFWGRTSYEIMDLTKTRVGGTTACKVLYNVHRLNQESETKLEILLTN